MSAASPTSRAGFTFLEVMVSLTIFLIIAAAVMPEMTSTHRARVTAAANLLASDIELAQVLCMANPDDPVILRLEPNGPQGVRYWLAFASDPNTPMWRSETIGGRRAEHYGLGSSSDNGDIRLTEPRRPYEITFGQGPASGARGVTMQIVNGEEVGLGGAGGYALGFDAHGALAGVGEPIVIELRHGDEWVRLHVAPSTGTVTRVSGNDS